MSDDPIESVAVVRLTDVSPWPERKDSKERFDEKIQISMNQISTMVSELNNFLIPTINQFVSTVETFSNDIQTLKDRTVQLNESLSQLNSDLQVDMVNMTWAGPKRIVDPDSNSE